MSQQDPRLTQTGAEHHKGEATYVGHILEPVKITQTQSGRQVANARIQICKLGPVDQQTGQAPIRYDNYSVKIWGSAANILQSAQVGQEICVTGEIENESWTDQQTQQKRYRTVILGRSVFLGGKSRYPIQSHAAAAGQPAAQHNYGQAPQQSYGQAPQQSYGQPTQHQYAQPSQQQQQAYSQPPQGHYPPPAQGGPLQRPAQPSYPVQPQAQQPQAAPGPWVPPSPPGLENIPF